MKPETEIGKWLLGHKKEVIKGFKDSFDLILELERYPEKLEKLPRKGMLIDTKKGKMIISLEKEKPRVLLL